VNRGGESVSKSENRQKQKRITFRLHEDEYATLETAADNAGLTLGSYIRERVLAAPRMKKRRRITVEVEALGRLQGAMNKFGSNLQPIAKRLNHGAGTPEAREIFDALAGYREVIAEIMTALGRAK
jgi:uncharacterized protein (DUF1778 family)